MVQRISWKVVSSSTGQEIQRFHETHELSNKHPEDQHLMHVYNVYCETTGNQILLCG